MNKSPLNCSHQLSTIDMEYTFETPRLWLEPLTLDKHLSDFHELWTDHEAVKWSYVAYPS